LNFDLIVAFFLLIIYVLLLVLKWIFVIGI
jgi:hypothetical protein